MVDEDYTRMGGMRNSDAEEIVIIVVVCMDLTGERKSVRISSS
jgi:hypothetical protein